ncbi:hypothetical protein [Streptococcus chenjunshii]|uniref:hypothetical protein n=1 Tax=Streptococcus chenjunshii TaxID=2173853 RepID=UPI0013C370CA|nr:hypothetical protein [Streptococcus chenjunshii]
MSSYTDERHKQIAEQEYELGDKLNAPVKISQGEEDITIGKVASIQDGTDSGSGEQV